MSHYRTDYRSAAAAAVLALPSMDGVTRLSAWSENIDAATLPVMGVVTPSERSAPSTHGSFEKGTLLQIVLKRLGDEDIEARLDDESAEIEGAVFGAVQTREVQCLLEETSVVVNGEGARRIGTLIMSFRVTSWRPMA